MENTKTLKEEASFQVLFMFPASFWFHCLFFVSSFVRMIFIVINVVREKKMKFRTCLSKRLSLKTHYGKVMFEEDEVSNTIIEGINGEESLNKASSFL